MTKKLLIISGHDLTERFKIKYHHLEDVQTFLIPNAHKFFPVKENYFFPDIYNQVVEKIRNIDLSGYIVITGTGFSGKYLNIECKKQGAISIDLGSVMDLFEGIKTRGLCGGLGMRKDKRYKI